MSDCIVEKYKTLIATNIGVRYAKSVVKNEPSWIIQSPPWSRFTRFALLKQEIMLNLLNDFPNSFLKYNDCGDMAETAINHNWPEVANDTWVIPAKVDCRKLYLWLYQDFWIVYGSDEGPLDEIDYVGLLTPEGIYDFTHLNGLVYSLAGYPHHDPWVFILNKERL